MGFVLVLLNIIVGKKISPLCRASPCRCRKGIAARQKTASFYQMSAPLFPKPANLDWKQSK